MSDGGDSTLDVTAGDAPMAAGRVTFDSHGEKLVGHVFPAAFGPPRSPAVAILGPMTFQKEQAPLQYARRLSQLGYTALAFDTRYRGESGGQPRCYESPASKGEDLRAALSYLGTRADVDAGRLAVLGICMGGSHVLPVAADDGRVRAVATVAGHYPDRASDVAWLGSDAAVDERRRRGRAAQAAYDATGEVTLVPAVDFARVDVGMPGELVWSWYQLWADRGLWDNRYAVMSDAALLSFESISAAARLAKPYLMVHSDGCAVPDAARRHFAVVPIAEKQLLWEGETRHLQFYDDPAVIDRTVWSIADWFARHLAVDRPAPPAAGHVELVRRFFDLLGRFDVEAWGELWADDGRIVVPYPPEGFASRIDGKSEILAAFRTLFGTFRSFACELRAVYPTAGADTVTAEYGVRATLADGTTYTNDNIAVFELRDGLVSAYHDYFDPRRFQAVVDAMVPA